MLTWPAFWLGIINHFWDFAWNTLAPPPPAKFKHSPETSFSSKLEKNPFPLGQNMAAFQGAIYSIFIAAICCGEIPQNYHIFAWFDQFDASKNRYHFTIPYQQKTLALHGLTMIPHKKKHVRIQGGDLNQSNLQQLSPLFFKGDPAPSPCWAFCLFQLSRWRGHGSASLQCFAQRIAGRDRRGSRSTGLWLGLSRRFCWGFTWRKRKKTPGWLVYSSKEMMLLLLLLLLLLFSVQVWKVCMVQNPRCVWNKVQIL